LLIVPVPPSSTGMLTLSFSLDMSNRWPCKGSCQGAAPLAPPWPRLISNQAKDQRCERGPWARQGCYRTRLAWQRRSILGTAAAWTGGSQWLAGGRDWGVFTPQIWEDARKKKGEEKRR
jgi:hypothetical protein